MTGLAGATATLVGLLGVGVLIGLAAERLRVPSAVALVAFGVGAAAIHPVALPFRFDDALLFIFLPPLIFEAAWSIDIRSLRRTGRLIALLAVPGVVLVAGTIGFGVALTGLMPAASAFVLGSIVSATDPVAVLAIFRRLGIPRDLRTVVEGESIANDGVAIALYTAALAFAGGIPAPSLLGAALAALASVAGGCAIGIGCAFAVALVIGRARTSQLEVAATVVLAFLAYLGAGAVHCSGVFATAAAAVALRSFANIASVSEPDEVDAFWRTIAFIANAMVFLATGLVLRIDRIAEYPLLIVVALAAVVLSRVVLALLMIRSRPWRVTFIFAGMRGGLSLALALALPQGLPGREAIVDAVFAVVLFTVVVQGATIEPLLLRLGLRNGSSATS